MKFEKNVSKIISIFFLILFINSIFAYNVDFSRFDNPTESANNFYLLDSDIKTDFGGGCYTEELPSDAVERIWNELLVKGFKVDIVSSDQPAKTDRDSLEKSDVMLTNQDSKGGDIIMKKEMPSQEMDPLEIPTILGQSCYGPFSYGINLTETIRIGKCENDTNSACYLESDGLFRQNGNEGFWTEMEAVGKDVLDMVGVNILKQEAGEIINPDYDYNTDVDLGIFTEMSYEELAFFKSIQLDDANKDTINLERTKAIMDKAIQNSVKTEIFNSGMETTCSGENCYINVYSLFDKMFNQFFSADLVATSVSPLLWKFSSRIFSGIGNVAKKQFGIESAGQKLLKNGTIKKGHFWDNVLNNNNSPMKALKKTMDIRVAERNIGRYADNLSSSYSSIEKQLNRYDLKPQFEKYLKSLKSKKNIEEITNEFFKSAEFTKLNKPQQRIFFEIAQKYQTNLKITQIFQEQLGKDIDDILSATTTVRGASIPRKDILSNSKYTLDDFYRSLTKEEYETLLSKQQKMNQLNKSWGDYTNGHVSWDDGVENLNVVMNRSFTIHNPATGEDELTLINKVKKLDQTIPGSLGELPAGSKALVPTDPTKSIGTGFDKMAQTKKVTVTFSDGSTAEITKLIPYKESEISSIGQQFFASDLPKFQSRPDIYIEYLSKSGATKKVRATNLIVDDIDQVGSLKWFSVDDVAMLTDDEIIKYGYDPFELAYGYSTTKGTEIIKTMDAVNDKVVKVMEDQGWVTGRGVNWINQQMKAQDTSSYQKKAFNMLTRNGQAYIKNWVYWEVQTAGNTLPFIGDTFSKYSMYQLPETYTSVKIDHQLSGEIYNDSYIDFFVNTGSDQGDLFMQYLNSMVFWLVNIGKEVLDETDWKATQAISDWGKQITEGQIRRSSVDDVAVFTDGENGGCDKACSIKIGNSQLLEKTTLEKSLKTDTNVENQTPMPQKLEKVNIIYSTPSGITIPNYILENTDPKNIEEEGQTLISFSHHTDYSGSLAGKNTKDADKVNLITAIENEETCSAKIRDLEVLGVPIGFTTSWTGKNYRAGLVAATYTTLAYTVLSAPQHRILLGTIFGVLIPQGLIIPQVHNCVDDEEGYYTHIFVSKEEYERIEKDPKNKIGDLISKGAEGIEQKIEGVTKGTQLEESVKKTTQDVKQFAETKMKDNPIVQARFETKGNSSASINGRLFFLELGKNTTCRASAYNDKGVEYLKNNQLNETLIINKENGTLDILDSDGTLKNIIDSKNKDWVRLMATNLGIPAKVIPHSLSYIPLPDDNSPLFTMDIYGNLSIENMSFLDCFRKNYEAQTGLELRGNQLTDILGSVKMATTTNPLNPSTQYDMIPKGKDNVNEILAEGVPRKSAQGNSAKMTILGDRYTKLYPVNNKEETFGQNISIQFERGQLIYNGEKNSYILWVEQTYSMHQSEIGGLNTSVKKYTNPETGCEEFALGFSVNPVENNEDAKNKSKEMNKALEKVGPFQLFETATKTFIFYTTPAPECEKRMKIIDKLTGKVITDQAITDIIETPNGMIVKTADGAEHNFEFSAEDGVPKLKYNDELETLLSAQGKNGSFWYDPATGNWYTENGHLIPFDPQYKDGMMFKTGEDGKVYGTPAENPMNINIGSSGSEKSGFNIPLSPEKVIPLSLYLFIIIMSIMYINNRKGNIKKEK